MPAEYASEGILEISQSMFDQVVKLGDTFCTLPTPHITYAIDWIVTEK